MKFRVEVKLVHDFFCNNVFTTALVYDECADLDADGTLGMKKVMSLWIDIGSTGS